MATEQQKEHLVTLMEENYKFLFGTHPTVSGKSSKVSKWIEITNQLNELGPIQEAFNNGKM